MSDAPALPAPKRGRGQPPYKVKDGEPMLVRMLVANGTPQAQIASFMKISLKTLKKHFRDEIDNGHAQIVARVGLSCVQKALAGDNEMMKFWLRTHGGKAWSPPTQIELSGPNGEALQPPTLVVGFMTGAAPPPPPPPPLISLAQDDDDGSSTEQ